MAYKLIDLFCGAGGMTLGFTDPRFGGGFRSILAVDNEQSAIDTFNRNFGNHGRCEDIEQFLETSAQFPEADVVIGGPPCQGFSLLNKGRENDIRRALWQPYMDIVERSKARVFVIENVPGLLKSFESAQIRDKAAELGFKVISDCLLAADYGVPQTRKRAMIVGWKPIGGAAPDFPPRPSHTMQGNGSNLKPWATVQEAIGDLPTPVGTEIREEPAPFNLHFGRSPTAMSVERYKAVPPGGNRFDLQKNAPHITPQCWIRKTSGGTDLFGRLWWDRPSVTIRTEFFKPEKGRYLHPEAHRPITHREAARLMGFPDDFEFCGTKIQIAKQIGNAVPPGLGGAISAMVFNLLSDMNVGKAA